MFCGQSVWLAQCWCHLPALTTVPSTPLCARPRALLQAAPSPRLPSATKSVLSMASKAQDLLQKQGAIEQEVQDR